MNEYTRCKNCSFVYETTLTECPECGTPNSISEDLDDSTVFNIID